MSQAKLVTAATFAAEVQQSDVPVVVDFFANWCAPCRMMGPILDKVAEQIGDRARIVKVDVDEDPELASHFRVSSIPALILFHNGQVVANTVGLTQADKLVAMINRTLSDAVPTCR